MSQKRTKMMRREARQFAQRVMKENILGFQTLPFWDRWRIAKAILLEQGDGSPKK
jgi:hypothetical protein